MLHPVIFFWNLLSVQYREIQYSFIFHCTSIADIKKGFHKNCCFVILDLLYTLLPGIRDITITLLQQEVLRMNPIGIIGAMDEEVARLKEQMSGVHITTKAMMDFYQGTLEGKPVVIVRSGIGKINAAVCTQILVDDFQVKAVINTGIAGSLRSWIDIGDIVISTDALHHDMDATNFGYPLGQVPRMDVLAFKADEAMAQLAKEVCEEVNPEIHAYLGRVVSGDQFIADSEVKNRILENFGGYCTEMEGAAIAHTAYLNKVPFVILRAISDKADNSATMDYPTFEKQAIEHSVRLTMGMLKRM